MAHVKCLHKVDDCDVQWSVRLRVEPNRIVEKACQIRCAAAVPEAVLILMELCNKALTRLYALCEDLSEGRMNGDCPVV